MFVSLVSYSNLCKNSTGTTETVCLDKQRNADGKLVVSLADGGEIVIDAVEVDKNLEIRMCLIGCGKGLDGMTHLDGVFQETDADMEGQTMVTLGVLHDEHQTLGNDIAFYRHRAVNADVQAVRLSSEVLLQPLQFFFHGAGGIDIRCYHSNVQLFFRDTPLVSALCCS